MFWTDAEPFPFSASASEESLRARFAKGWSAKKRNGWGASISAGVTDEEIEGADVGESVNCSYRAGIRASEADTAWARRDRELRRRFAGAMPRKLAAERRENMRRFPDPE